MSGNLVPAAVTGAFCGDAEVAGLLEALTELAFAWVDGAFDGTFAAVDVGFAVGI